MYVRACVCWPQLEARSAREEAPTAEPLANRLLFILLADHPFFSLYECPDFVQRLSFEAFRFVAFHDDTL